ncbi:MAG: HDOD domain-containing protein [Deltaproteobacteria bacterium]|nr:HDOD domain-containing protein [Deltaproteobacteria bacterium]
MQFQKPIFDQISTSRNLPTLPHILFKLIEAFNDKNDHENINNITEILNKDPALSTKILKFVNSAFSGLSRRVFDIRQAVILIGVKGVKNIATCACVYEAFQKVNGNRVFNLKRFWFHSLKCAVLARLIAEKENFDHPDEAFISGLLHDIGKLVLWTNFPKAYDELLLSSDSEPHLLLKGEEKLGATHCEIAAWLLSRWNMPPSIIDPILFHHYPKNRIMKAFPLVKFVYAANSLCLETQEKDLITAEEILGIDFKTIDAILTVAQEETAKVAESLDIDIDIFESPAVYITDKDQKKRNDLLKEVKNSSLLLGTVQSFVSARNQNEILEAVFQAAQELFDIRQIIFFILEPDKNILFAKLRDRDGSFTTDHGLTVPANLEDSILNKAIKSRNSLDSFRVASKSELNAFDAKILEAAGADGLLCIPLSAGAETIGLLVFGLSLYEFKHVLKQMRLLSLFADQAALALHSEYLRRTRLQTIQSERFSASSDVVRKIIHEVNNPLGIIKNYLKILDLKFAGQQILHDEIRIINEEIERVADLLQRLSEFSTEKTVKNQPVEINTLIRDILKISRESLVKNFQVDIRLDLEETLPFIMAERDTIKQVFINIIMNSVEAMKKGGALIIKTRFFPFSAKRSSPEFKTDYSGYIEIYFIDEGPGIPENIREKIFDPFITTKGANHSGVGLSVVHNIVKSLNGNIICESEENKGTTFKIEFPV